MKFGEQLRFYREEMRLTRDAVAALTAVSGGSVSNYERGKRCPPVEWVERFSRSLDLSDDEHAALVYARRWLM